MSTGSREVFFPPVGIVHLLDDIVDLVAPRAPGSRITVATASQPNSNPHLGTITTIMSSFALAEHLRQKLSIETEVLFDQLENAPGHTVERNGLIYQRSLELELSANGEPLAKEYMRAFLQLFRWLASETGIEYRVRPYSDFQRARTVRRLFHRVVEQRAVLEPILAPLDRVIRLRSACPICGLTEKACKTLVIVKSSCSSHTMEMQCADHGPYQFVVSEESADLLDANTPLRSVVKGVAFAEDFVAKGDTVIMVDGADWSGAWLSNVYYPAVHALGVDAGMGAIRLFAPLITDWSGAKFSKSLYLRRGAYAGLPKGFLDHRVFMEVYGEQGLMRLLDEVRRWIREPRRFFRSYSIEYLTPIVSGLHPHN